MAELLTSPLLGALTGGSTQYMLPNVVQTIAIVLGVITTLAAYIPVGGTMTAHLWRHLCFAVLWALLLLAAPLDLFTLDAWLCFLTVLGIGFLAPTLHVLNIEHHKFEAMALVFIIIWFYKAFNPVIAVCPWVVVYTLGPWIFTIHAAINSNVKDWPHSDFYNIYNPTPTTQYCAMTIPIWGAIQAYMVTGGSLYMVAGVGYLTCWLLYVGVQDKLYAEKMFVGAEDKVQSNQVGAAVQS